MINRGRIGFQEGGFITMKDNGDFVVTYPSGSSSLYSGTADAEFLQNLISQGYHVSGTYEPLSAQEQNERETRRYESFEINPITGNRERVMREGNSTSLNDPIVAIFDKEKGFVDLDTPTKYPFGQPEVPIIDPFSGEQVSAQEQAAFTQQQDIFPQQELPTVTPEAPFQPYQSEPSNVGIFVGPSFDKYSAARTDAYANAPSKFDYDVTANQAAGQFAQDRAREIYGDNIFGRGIGALGAVAGVPIAMFASPFHEAAQVITQGRMKPGSGIEGFYKAFMNELPFSTAANRAAGVMKSIPGVGEPIYQGAYKLGEGLANLTSRDPVLSSLTKNFNNLTLQEMDKIRNTSREKLIEQARSAGQEGGMGYLLGF